MSFSQLSLLRTTAERVRTRKTQLVNPAPGSGNRLGLGRVRNGDSDRWEKRYCSRSGTIYFVFVFELTNESNSVILGIVINIEESLHVFLIDNVSTSENWWWTVFSFFYRQHDDGGWDRTRPLELAYPGLGPISRHRLIQISILDGNPDPVDNFETSRPLIDLNNVMRMT